MKRVLKAGLLVAGMLAASSLQAMPLAPMEAGSRSGVVLAQAVNPELQIQQLEETIRDLNGRIEELNFQMLQMQEQMRKMQEDNEFRFQELEKGGTKKSGALDAPAGEQNQVETAGAEPPAADAGSEDTLSADAGADAPASDDITIDNQEPQSAQLEHIKPGTLGSLIFNSDGNVVESTRSETVQEEGLPGVSVPQIQTGGGAPPASTAMVGGSEDNDYQMAYSLILSGDYGEAEQSFKSFLEQYPEGTRAADASFWLGEAQYSQGKFKDAAETFLNTYKAYSNAPKAPEVLLKLGMSLAELDNRETACATLKEIPKRFPKASKAVITKVATEQSKLGC
ncbi:tol-pal system protein YbgF [Rhizobium sp. L1K21]|uniref:tol-pal system protein YbgF n=1 Tax=Rhizobium sp. L1K21 TaxID=2954933 RepID=UPI0020939205|nr:tol-pal system protein YbgF [Rhizobium sp. L1K21]MCO6185107.1 tol-pal system protein YbgF [Rhizobium sp. L1K21]